MAITTPYPFNEPREVPPPPNGCSNASLIKDFTFLQVRRGIVMKRYGELVPTFTHLQALQKGTQLYDQLIGKGKLDESWEAKLVNVSISMRRGASGEEIVVAFKRESGDPGTVYIFFKMDGEYAGSNFTGD